MFTCTFATGALVAGFVVSFHQLLNRTDARNDIPKAEVTSTLGCTCACFSLVNVVFDRCTSMYAGVVASTDD